MNPIFKALLYYNDSRVVYIITKSEVAIKYKSLDKVILQTFMKPVTKPSVTKNMTTLKQQRHSDPDMHNIPHGTLSSARSY